MRHITPLARRLLAAVLLAAAWSAVLVGAATLPVIRKVNVGTTANDGTGDSLRVTQQKANDNFTAVTNYLGQLGTNSGGGSTTLSNLTDVDVAGVVNGQALVFDGTEWVPGNPTAVATNAVAINNGVSTNQTLVNPVFYGPTNFLTVITPTNTFQTNVANIDVGALLTNLPSYSTVYIGPGTYQTRGMIFTQRSLRFLGAGKGTTTFKLATNAYVGGEGKSTIFRSYTTNDFLEIGHMTLDANAYGVISHTNATVGIGTEALQVYYHDLEVKGIRGMQLYATEGSEGFGVINVSYAKPKAGSSIFERIHVHSFGTNHQTRAVRGVDTRWIFATGIYLEQHGTSGSTNSDQSLSVVRDCSVDFRIDGITNLLGAVGISANSDTMVEGNTVRGALNGIFRDTYTTRNLYLVGNNIADCDGGIALPGLEGFDHTSTNIVIQRNMITTRYGGYAIGLIIYSWNPNDYMQGVDISHNTIYAGPGLTNTAFLLVNDGTSNSQISNVRVHHNMVVGNFAKLPSYVSGTSSGIWFHDNFDQNQLPYQMDRTYDTYYNASYSPMGRLGFYQDNTLFDWNGYGSGVTNRITTSRFEVVNGGSQKLAIDSTGLILSNSAVRGWIPFEYGGSKYGRAGFSETVGAPNDLVWENWSGSTNQYAANGHRFLISGSEAFEIRSGVIEVPGYAQFFYGGSSVANIGTTANGLMEWNVFGAGWTNRLSNSRLELFLSGNRQVDAVNGEFRFTNTLVRFDANAFLSLTNAGGGLRDYMRVSHGGSHSANIGIISTNRLVSEIFSSGGTNSISGARVEISSGGGVQLSITGAGMAGNGVGLTNLKSSATVSAGANVTVTASLNPDGSTNYQVAASGGGGGSGSYERVEAGRGVSIVLTSVGGTNVYTAIATNTVTAIATNATAAMGDFTSGTLEYDIAQMHANFTFNPTNILNREDITFTASALGKTNLTVTVSTNGWGGAITWLDSSVFRAGNVWSLTNNAVEINLKAVNGRIMAVGVAK